MIHLILQNNILDLWSLFDFLMPGFLGTERQVCVLLSKLYHIFLLRFVILIEYLVSSLSGIAFWISI